jgi:pimeloyl-ACP methyl ester carboxylesterase
MNREEKCAMKTPTLVDLEDGRKIEVRTAGPEDGEVLLFHHGTPGAGLPFRPWMESAAARGLRTVMYSRPGYGLSTADPGRKVVDAASDAAAVLDAVDATTFRTIGWSGGGPHALACAAALRDRCLTTVAVAGFAPYPADGIDWFTGMADENVAEYSLALRGEGVLAPFLEASAHTFATMQPANLAESFGGLLSEADKAQMTGEFAEWLAETFRVGLTHGIAGMRDDELAETSDWGFPVADARSVVVWHGVQDRMVPSTHGRWLADHIPGARLRLFDNEGHMSIIGLFDRILDDLLDPAVGPNHQVGRSSA